MRITRTAFYAARVLERMFSTPGPKYCTECGAANDSQASYCVGCGKIFQH